MSYAPSEDCGCSMHKRKRVGDTSRDGAFGVLVCRGRVFEVEGVFVDVVCIETKEGRVVGWGGGFGSICFHVLSS